MSVSRTSNGAFADRYARQVILPAIGREGQKRLLESKVLLVGCGALGTGIANHLARAGVGTIRIVDRDFVESSNLQRQVLFEESDVTERMPKAVAAAAHIARINSSIIVEPVVADVNFTNVEQLAQGVDLILDGLDNLHTRYLINDVSVKLGIPWVYGACVGTWGMVMAVRPGQTPCLRCAFPTPTPAGLVDTCDTAGVLNGAAMIVASMQSIEAFKLLTGQHEVVVPGVLDLDLWTMTFERQAVPRDPDCPCCHHRRFEFLTGEEGVKLTSLCGRNAVQIVPARPSAVDLELLARRAAGAAETKVNRFLVRISVENLEITVFQDGRAIVTGTNDLSAAQSAYAKYVGT